MRKIIKNKLANKGTATALVVTALLVGVAGGSVLKIAQSDAQTTTAAATSDSSATATQQQNTNNQQHMPPKDFDPTKGGHVGKNGIKEELLTGDTAEKVKAAAQAAVSGGTIQRVETDAEGATYEAHMTKSDGSLVTVKLDGNFIVTSVEDGPQKPPTQNQK